MCIRRQLLCVSALALVVNSAAGSTIFFDDFGDGSLSNDVPVTANGMPVRWLPEGSQLSAATGDLVVQSSFDSVPSAYVDSLLMPGDVSVRFQGRLTTDGLIGMQARGHWTLLNADGTASIGRLGSSTGLGVVPTSFNPLANEVVMQFDAVGTTYSLWVWNPGDAMPPQPVVRVTDNSQGDNRIGIGGVSSSFPSAGDNFEAIFRYVHVADTPIPEPSSAVFVLVGSWAAVAIRKGRLRWTN
jgi:hypothetical protein